MRSIVVIGVCMVLAGCATASPIMDAGNGTYLISAHASAVRGGATGAQTVAYKDANAFCAKNGNGHAVVVNNPERDVYQSSAGGSWGRNGGSFAGGTTAAGNVDMRFRCSQ